MEETKNSALQQNMKYILILIGVAALVLSYFMGYSKYQTDISDIKDEISSLETRYNDLKSKESKRGEYQKKKKEVEEKYDTILSKFDAGLSAKRIIMDCHNIASQVGLSFTSLSMSEPKISWVFGTEKKDGKVNSKDQMSYEMMASVKNYTIQVTGTYSKTKDYIKQIMSDQAKRRVPVSLSFAFDPTLHTVSCNLNVMEYAISSKDRTESITEIPLYNQGINNIFFTDLGSNDNTPQ
ncbi:MAG: hypothetical protein HFI34_02720 [Lachnospiraceae bacterium]|nr:hypothetical protein [Lachnospiraceae bacterium]